MELDMIRKPVANELIIDLDGPDGNAFFLLGSAKTLASKFGYSSERTKRITEEMMEADYESLVFIFDYWFGDNVILETTNEELLDATDHYRAKI